MKSLKCYINEGFKIGKTKAKSYNNYTCQPKDKDELKKIIKERLNQDWNADLNDIDVSKITDMSELFVHLRPHEIDISKWDVSRVEDMSYMFYECNYFNCDLSDWDVSSVKNMRCMFTSCNNFEGEGLENWKTTSVVNMRHMFLDCKSLKNTPNWYAE